jgi:hypothetical protein
MNRRIYAAFAFAMPLLLASPSPAAAPFKAYTFGTMKFTVSAPTNWGSLERTVKKTKFKFDKIGQFTVTRKYKAKNLNDLAANMRAKESTGVWKVRKEARLKIGGNNALMMVLKLKAKVRMVYYFINTKNGIYSLAFANFKRKYKKQKGIYHAVALSFRAL